MISCVSPGHEDHNPSLHASWEPTSHGGRTLLYCHSCTDITQEEWAEYLGLEYDELFDDRRWSLHQRPRKTSQVRRTGGTYGRLGPTPDRIARRLPELLGQPVPQESTEHHHSYAVVEEYPYLDSRDRLVHKVIRQRCTECGEKNFPQVYTDGAGGWKSKQPRNFRVRLYRHAQLEAAAKAGGEVWLLEGEKDVHTAERLALVATTNPGGATAFPKALATAFMGAHVSVVLDRDDAGWTRGVDTYRLLTEAGAATVRLLLPAPQAPKSDFTDHVEAGHELPELLEVPVGAVTAWALLRTVRRHVNAIESAEDEARAQLRVSAHDAEHGRRAKAKDRHRYASRWAKETSRVHIRLLEAVRQVQGAAAQVPGDLWAAEAAQVAESALRAATSVARATYELCGELAPAELCETVPVVASSAAFQAAAPMEGRPQQERPQLVGIPGGGGGGGSSRWIPGVKIEHPEYELINGELVEVKWVASGRGEDSEVHKRLIRVINAPLTIRRKEFAETEEDIDSDNIDLDSLGDREGRERLDQPKPLRKLTHVVFSLPGDDGQDMLVRVPADEVENGGFLAELPIKGLSFNRSRSGRDKVMSAVNQISTDHDIVTAFRATGWRRRPDGTDFYVLADGAIDAKGFSAAPTNLSGPMARFNLPNPSTEAAQVRQAFLGDSAGMMDRFPDRIAAVLLGTAYRAVVCPNEWVTVLSSSPGVGKTGLGALTMHHFGELWDRMRPMSSMSGNGATTNALRILAHQAKDAVLFLDDNAPTNGVENAYKLLEQTIRLIHNQEGRGRSSRDGQEVLPSSRPRTSALITTELPPRAGTSGERRALIVPMSRLDVEIDAIKAMDSMGSRHGRALLTASFLRWMAEDRAAALVRVAALRENFLTWMQDQPGWCRAWERHAAKIAELMAGWGLLLDFLTDLEALSLEEASQWRDRVASALTTAAECAEDPDLVASTGQRACELLRYALSNGAAYASDVATNEAPHRLERRLGYRQAPNRSSSSMPEPPDWRPDPRAVHLGYVSLTPTNTTGDDGPELICTRSGLEAVLKAAAAQMTDTSAPDLGTVLRALEDEEVLKVQLERRRGGVVVRRTLMRTIFCESSLADPSKPVRDKRVVLRLDALFGGPDTDPDGGDPPVEPPRPAGGSPQADPDGPDRPTTTPLFDATPPAEEPQDHSDEESTMQAHANAAGLRLRAVQLEDCRACQSCGMRCGVSFSGVPLHLRCYWLSSSTTAQDLQREFQTPSANAPVAPAEPEDEIEATAPSTPAPPATDSKRPTKVAPRRFIASAAVVDVDAIWLPDGTRQDLPFPIEHLGHLEQLGRELNLGHPPMKWHKYDEPGLVVPTPALWKALGVPSDEVPTRRSKRADWYAQVSKDLPSLTMAVKDGWTFGRGEGDPILRGLTRLRRSDAERGSVAVMFTPALPKDWGLDLATVEPSAVARRLHLFAQTIGLSFRGSPISTGLDLLAIVLPKDVRDQLRVAKPVDYSEIGPASMAELEVHFDWQRQPRPDEAKLRYLMLFDRGGSYLSTWSSLKLGVGEPELHTEDVVFDAKCAGWWLVRIPSRPDDGSRDPFPDVLDPHGNRAGQEAWVTTPVLEFATKDLDLEIEVIKAWMWPPERSKTVLNPLYVILRDALNQLRDMGDEDADAVAFLVKQIYKQLSGHFASDDAASAAQANPDKYTWHHPYWFHAMRGAARKAIAYNIRKVGNGPGGTWPLVASNNDAIGYATDSLDPAEAWPGDPAKLGYGLGQYKGYRFAEMSEQLPHLDGVGGWSGLNDTQRVTEATPGSER